MSVWFPSLNDSAQPGRRSQLQWLAVAVIAVACVWFFTLDARHLLRTDEGRYAEIAREMFLSGDWVTPRYNDLKYFEKPPLHLWMTALSYHAFGVGEWQARLWVALSGAIGLLLTALAAARWFGVGAGLLTALALLAAPSWNIGSHFNSLDMSVSGALACVLAGLMLAQHPQTDAAGRRRWMAFTWAAMGVAVLTKGLIGLVLPGLALVVYTLWVRDLVLWRRLHVATGLACLLAITAPWFVLVARSNPEFTQFFFVHEHWERYTSSVHQRGAPVWYFVPQLLGGLLPWLGLAPVIVARLRTEAPSGGALQPLPLLVAWALSIFAFFSLSGSKLPGYILPMFPALAMLVALGLERLSARAWGRQLLGALIVSVLLMLASPLLGRLPGEGATNAALHTYAPWLGAAFALVAAGALLALWQLRRGRLRGSMVAYGLAVFFGTTVGLVGHETLGRGMSGVDLVPAMRAQLAADTPVYGVRMLDHTLPFYLGRTLVMVESADELEFGTQQEPHKWLPTLAAFKERWRAGPRALAVMSHETYAQLQGEGLPMVSVAKDARRIVVSNSALVAPP